MGAAGIAVPTLISTLAICCVFVSVFFLQGAARYLFTPLAMAVVFAMLASYGISRTLTPIMIGLLIRKEHERHGEATRLVRRVFMRDSTPGSTSFAISTAGCSPAFCGAPF